MLELPDEVSQFEYYYCGWDKLDEYVEKVLNEKPSMPKSQRVSSN